MDQILGGWIRGSEGAITFTLSRARSDAQAPPFVPGTVRRWRRRSQNGARGKGREMGTRTGYDAKRKQAAAW